jgi:hypothetical protein
LRTQIVPWKLASSEVDDNHLLAKYSRGELLFCVAPLSEKLSENNSHSWSSLTLSQALLGARNSCNLVDEKGADAQYSKPRLHSRLTIDGYQLHGKPQFISLRVRCREWHRKHNPNAKKASRMLQQQRSMRRTHKRDRRRLALFADPSPSCPTTQGSQPDRWEGLVPKPTANAAAAAAPPPWAWS